MGRINPTYFDRVRYILLDNEFPPLQSEEPLGWKEDEKELTRNTDHHGIFTKFSNTIVFVGDAAQRITDVLEIFGINAELRLVKDERHPQTNKWVRVYDGFLDLSTYEMKNGQVSIKFNSGGLEQILKTRESEKVELEREETIDGSPLPPLPTQRVYEEGRKIFLVSQMQFKEPDGLEYNSDGLFATTGPKIPLLKKVSSSDERIREVFQNSNLGLGPLYVASDENFFYPEEQQFFYWNNDRFKTLRFEFDIVIKALFTFTGIDNQFIRFRFQKSRIGENGEIIPVETIGIYQLNGNGQYFTSNYQDFQFSNVGNPFEVEIAENECLALIISTYGLAATWLKYERLKLHITENSFFEPTTTEVVLAHEKSQRLMHIITDREDAFYSEVLGRTDLGYSKDGKASLTAFTHGLWVRGFSKEPETDENKYKPMTTSWREFMDSLSVIWNLGLGIERIGLKERIRIEEKSYFYNNQVLIRLPYEVTNYTRKVASEYYFSGIEVGYDKGGKYEEAMGLDEPNALSTFTSCIHGVKNIFKKVCGYRTDGYGREFARRKPKSRFPTEDTQYDQHIFVMDLIRDFPNIFRLRYWQDDFAEKPTGIYDPDSATELRFSPINLLLRHGWVIAAGLLKYPTDYIRNGSSTANSKLKTKLRTDAGYAAQPTATPGNGNAYKENGKFQNKELPKPRFKAWWAEFEHPVDFDVAQQLDGKTEINGKEIPNVYGLVEIKKENNELERGFLFNQKRNGAGYWKILIVNR